MLTRELLEKNMYESSGKTGLSILHASEFTAADQALLIAFLQEHKEITMLTLGIIGSSTIAALSTIQSLTEFSFIKCGLTAQDVAALAARPNLSLLEIEDDPIGNEGLAALAKSTSLKTLKVVNCGITSVVGLVGTSIEEIDLSGNALNDEGMSDFSKNNIVKKFKAASCGLTEISGEALANCAFLEELDLSKNTLDSEGFSAVLGNKTLVQLTVQDCKITRIPAEILQISSVRRLDMSMNYISDKGAAVLAQSQINDLTAVGCGITEIGAGNLASSKYLTYLDLTANLIGDAGASVLAANPRLHTLKLIGCDIGTKGAFDLAENCTLDLLDITGNSEVGNAGMYAFATNNSLFAENIVAHIVFDPKSAEFAYGMDREGCRELAIAARTPPLERATHIPRDRIPAVAPLGSIARDTATLHRQSLFHLRKYLEEPAPSPTKGSPKVG